MDTELQNKTAIIAGECRVTYAEMLAHVDHYASFTPKGKETKTIIFSENRMGWVYAFYAIWRNLGVVIPVDAGSTVQDVSYILNDAHPDAIWVSTKLEDVARDAMAESGMDIPLLFIDEYESSPVVPQTVTRDLLPWAALYRPENRDMALIIYTSGTTGSPKGVMLSYENIMYNVKGVTQDVPIFHADSSVLVLLPLHHVLPLVGTVVIPFCVLGSIAISPDLTGPDIMDTLCRGKVDIMVGVPRLWQSLYNGIMDKINASPVGRLLFRCCAKANSRRLSRLVFGAVHRKMGGHVAYCVSGGASLDKEIGNGLKTLGIRVLEGYGMTEAAPMIAFTRPDDIVPGCVGKPLSCVKMKVENGELCAKGPNVMLGYYNRPEETAAVMDEDGYLHTGDLGKIDDKGRVWITGRSKEIIVLSNGKNVQPNEIEYKLECYQDCIKEAAVLQDGDKLCAIVVPQPEWAEGKTEKEMERTIKSTVINPYNQSVANYKKLMSAYVYRGDLPRTKMEKLQRFKLKDVLDAIKQGFQPTAVETKEPEFEEYLAIRKFIETEKKVTVKPTDHLETDLAMDSLDKVSLSGFIEHSFGVDIKVVNLVSFPNIEAIAAHVAKMKTRVETEERDWNAFLHDTDKKLELPSPGWFYPILTKGLKCFFRLHNHLKVVGKDNIPVSGPYIVAANHQSFVDAPVVVAGMTSEQLKECYFYATEDHVRGSLRKNFARKNNVILMERSALKNSILKLAQVLKQGHNIVIFPEGRRTNTGDLGDFKKTFAILSKELNVPILPVCIKGAYEALPRSRKRLSTHPIQVEYLPAITPEAGNSYEELTKTVKHAIQDALSRS